MALLHSVPGNMTAHWIPEVRAVLDTWENYNITLEDFRICVLVKGLGFAKANNGIAWIVDSSKASGAFSKEIQDFIGTDIFPAFVANGIKYFITVTAEKAQTRVTIANYSAKAGPIGLQLVDAQSKDAAVEWLKSQGVRQ